jgi:hypothetical protein
MLTKAAENIGTNLFKPRHLKIIATPAFYECPNSSVML